MQQILLNFVFMRNTAAQKFQIHGRCTITCKNDLYLYAISRKNYDLNFACEISCKTGFVLIRK